MTENTYIRDPLRPMTVAGEIRELAVGHYLCLGCLWY